MNLTLPYPISANRYWRTFRGRQVVSKEAVEYKRAAAIAATESGLGGVFMGRVRVSIGLAPKKPLRASKAVTRCVDLDNALKVTIDALKGVCYADDAQIWSLYAERVDPVPGGAVYVSVQEIAE